jgi:hypothetical protein
MPFFTYFSITNTFSKNTSGDSKAKVAKQMGQAILLEFFKINPKVVGDCVKGKIDTQTLHFHLEKTLAKHDGMKACFQVPKACKAALEDR